MVFEEQIIPRKTRLNPIKTIYLFFSNLFPIDIHNKLLCHSQHPRLGTCYCQHVEIYNTYKYQPSEMKSAQGSISHYSNPPFCAQEWLLEVAKAQTDVSDVLI